MKNLSDFFSSPDTPIIKTIEIIDRTQQQISLVVDENRKLLGVVTDGDVRRAVLKGISLQDPVRLIMNTSPKQVRKGTARKEILEVMLENKIRHIPIVDERGVVADFQILEEFLEAEEKQNQVILMAGGEGQRLRPLTDNTPKPLLSIGDRPLLETIIKNFTESGFANIFLSVNYKAEMIKGHFGDGAALRAKIKYLEEDSFRGTAGALSLLPEKPTDPFFVMNADILTKVNFQQLLDFHVDHEADATMCVKEYDFQVPYGVVGTDHERITHIDEKPIKRFFVNAGIYVLSPSVLELIPRNERLDMPSLFDKIIHTGGRAVAFPIREYWMDIGQFADLERAQSDYPGYFKN